MLPIIEIPAHVINELFGIQTTCKSPGHNE